MPSVSKSQRRFMAICEHADHPAANCPHMTREQFHEFASTPERGLPMKKSKDKGKDKGKKDGKSKFNVGKKAEQNLRQGYGRK